MRFSLIAIRLIFILIVLNVSACTPEQAESPEPDRGTSTINLIHDPELTDYLRNAADQFHETGAKLADGRPIQINLQEQHALSASKSIASGEHKPDAWLSPSSTLVDFTNYNVRNLGSRQVNCTGLFKTPVVTATKRRNLERLNIREGETFSWDEIVESRLWEAQISETDERYLSYSFGSPLGSDSGLASLAQLAHLSSYKRYEDLTVETLKSEFSTKKIRQYQALVSQYGLNEQDLLGKASSEEIERLRLVLTTERHVAVYNQKRASSSPLVALYPKEGSYWQDYQLCESDADWMTPAKRAALREFTQFLLTPQLQMDIQQRGFRPIVQQPVVAPLTSNFGVNLSLPDESFAKLSPEVTHYLLDNWKDIKRKAAVLFVVDLSGGIDDEGLHTVKAEIRNFLMMQPASDKTALITFTTAPRILSGFTENSSMILSLLNSAEKLGGSAVNDSLKFAIDFVTGGKMHDYQRSIILITDGHDDSSQIDPEFLQDIVRDRFLRHDINLSVVGIESSISDFSHLREISRAANGRFHSGNASQLPGIMQEVFSGL